MIPKPRRTATQIVGNVGLYFVAYQLSKRHWNVLLTTRNAQGVDLVVYSLTAKRMHTVQVKSLSKRDPVPLGERLDSVIAEFFVVCGNVSDPHPNTFILRSAEVPSLAHRGEKDGRTSYWLQPAAYEPYRERWDLIGDGDDRS